MRVCTPHSGHTSCTFDACNDASRSTMPPLMFLPGFGFVWRLIMFTPSTIRRFFSGSTFSTRPRLPRSLPVMIRTLSFFRSGVDKRDTLENLRRERNNLHEAVLAQLARDWTEHAGADRFVVLVDQHGGVAVEPDVAAVAPALLFDGSDDHRFDDLPLLHRAFRRRFFHRRRDNVAQPRVAAGRSSDRIDDRDLARAGVV